VDWFNNRRLFEPIGNIPPVEFEALYYERQETPAMGVGLT
jgi:putative transposase